MTFRSIFAGALSLTALQAVLSSDASASRTGQLFTWFSSAIYRSMSPNVPLLPDRRLARGSSSASSSSTTPSGSGTASLGAGQFNPRTVPTPATPWAPKPTPSPTPNPAPQVAPSSYGTTST